MGNNKNATNISITQDDLSDGAIIALLEEHRQEMFKYSPVESIHALDTDKLNNPSITFWAARIGNNLAGCVALKALSTTTAEIKAMKTHTSYVRRGVAAKLLTIILQESKSRGYKELYLETGSNKAFAPAIALYEKFGFTECGPFGDYKPDPYSKFFCLEQ